MFLRDGLHAQLSSNSIRVVRKCIHNLISSWLISFTYFSKIVRFWKRLFVRSLLWLLIFRVQYSRVASTLICYRGSWFIFACLAENINDNQFWWVKSIERYLVYKSNCCNFIFSSKFVNAFPFFPLLKNGLVFEC